MTVMWGTSDVAMLSTGHGTWCKISAKWILIIIIIIIIRLYTLKGQDLSYLYIFDKSALYMVGQ